MGDQNEFYQQQAANVVGPRKGRIYVALVSDTAAVVDLNNEFGDLSDRIVTIRADGCKLYYWWHTDGTGVPDPATVGIGGLQVQGLQDGERSDEERPLDANGDPCNFFAFRCEAGGSGHVRIHVSSKAPQ